MHANSKIPERVTAFSRQAEPDRFAGYILDNVWIMFCHFFVCLFFALLSSWRFHEVYSIGGSICCRKLALIR